MVTDWGQPETDDGVKPTRSNLVRMPKALTAGNGARELLAGEFYETVEVSNPNYDDNDNEPETYNLKVYVSWDTIKEIYAKAVKGLGKKSQHNKEKSDDVSNAVDNNTRQ